MSAARGLLDTVIAGAEQNKAKKVKKVYAVLGELRFLPEEELKEHFETMAKGTIAEGAELVIEPKKAGFKCPNCGESGELPSDEMRLKIFTCPKCGSGIDIVSGKECFVRAVEMSD